MEKKYDVFISCKSEDYGYAEEVYNFLNSNGIRTFLASKELRKLGESEYREAIVCAIESSYHLIIFASKAQYTLSKWVKYEWDLFVSAKLDGRKDGQIMTILKGFNTTELRSDLIIYESFTFVNYKERLLSYVETPEYLARKEERIPFKSKENRNVPFIIETLEWQKKIGIEESNWDALIHNVLKGDVIPVIGSDFLANSNDNIQQQLIRVIAKYFNVKSCPSTFSELVDDIEYLKANKNYKDSIYGYINQLFSPNAPKQKPSELLERLLQSRLFPFVMTTSFVPIIEQIMYKIWGDDLKVMTYSNYPPENDDIIGTYEFSKPTIYYMLGRVGYRPHHYAVTDEDTMDYISSWDSYEKFIAPINLKEQLKKKKLLFIGNTIDKTEFLMLIKAINNKLSDCTYVYTDNQDSELIYYLLKNNVFIKNNINEFVEELIERISKARKDFIEKKQDANIDVYVSSSYKDNVIAEEICKNLAEKGFRVNTNHSSLISSEDYFNEMKQSIQNASFFVPILTKSIEEEHLEPHFYRIEWEQAIEVSRLYGRQFIIPVVEQGLDIFSLSIPKEFAQQNYVSYRDEADLEHVVTFITSRMPQIE